MWVAEMAQYFVIGPNGDKYGPADVDTLRMWSRENRVTAQTMLEDATTGARLMASAIPGLVLENPAPSYQQINEPYRKVANNLALSIFSTVCCCQLLGIIAIINAVQVDGHCRRGDYAAAEKSANTAKTLSIVGIVGGLIVQIGYVLIVVLTDKK